MDMLARGEADGVVTPYVDRFSRAGLADALDRIAEVRLLGALFIPLDAPDEMTLVVRLQVAHDQLQRHREAWRAGDHRAAELGVWLGPRPRATATSAVRARCAAATADAWSPTQSVAQ